MRITGFHVDGFGLLHDQQVHGVPAGTTVVLGPNEAGKSTLHAFLVRTLFGHPRANDAEGRNRHEPLRGGRHGGVVHCRDDAGDWQVHRHTEGSPRLRVVAPDGSEATGADALLPLVGRTVDETRYEQVFAIDLDDLAGVGALGDGALDDLLFDAATVGTGRSLRAARDEAVDRRDALWTPTSTKRPLAAALDREDQARQRLARARDAARGALDTRRRLDDARARVDDLGDEHREAVARVALLERVRDAWPAWSRAARLRDDLAELPEVTVDIGTLAAARDAAAAAGAAATTLAELDGELAEAADAAAGRDVNEAVLEASDRVEAMGEGLSGHELAVEQVGAAEQAAAAAAQAAADAVDDLGAGWDEDRVLATPVDVVAREQLEAAGDELLDARLHAEAAAERAEDAERLRVRRADAVADVAVPDVPPAHEISEAEQAVGVLRVGVPTLSTSAAAATRLSPVVLGVGLAVVAAVVVVVSAELARGLLLAAVVVACGVGLHLAGGRGQGTATEVADQVATAAAAVGLPPHPSLAEVEQVAARIDSARAARRDADAGRRAARRRQEEVAEATSAAAEAGRRARQRREALATARQDWAATCRRLGLDPDPPVRVTTALHARVAVAARLLAERDAADRELARLRPRVEEYREQATELVAELGHDAQGQAAVRLLPGIRERARAARVAREEVARLDARSEQLSATRARVAQEHDDAMDRLDRALTAADAPDLSTLEARADVVERRDELEQALASTEDAVAQLLGSGPRGAAGRALLTEADPTAWEEQLAAARRHRDELTAQRDDAVATRTRLDAELRRLGGDDAVPRAEQRLAAAEVEVAELSERWAVADTAAQLLEATVERFEREQQPRVLARASALFARATGGQWAQVRRLDGHVVVARAEGGEPVAASVLSRGTREQLWLCLRLALAEDLARDRPLPLLVDDLLGTSDPERSLHVARVLADVARTHQVWLFTCHPATADLITSTDPDAAVLRLRRGGRIAGLRHRDAAADRDVVLQLDV